MEKQCPACCLSCLGCWVLHSAQVQSALQQGGLRSKVSATPAGSRVPSPSGEQGKWDPEQTASGRRGGGRSCEGKSVSRATKLLSLWQKGRLAGSCTGRYILNYQLSRQNPGLASKRNVISCRASCYTVTGLQKLLGPLYSKAELAARAAHHAYVRVPEAQVPLPSLPRYDELMGWMLLPPSVSTCTQALLQLGWFATLLWQDEVWMSLGVMPGWCSECHRADPLQRRVWAWPVFRPQPHVINFHCKTCRCWCHLRRWGN